MNNFKASISYLNIRRYFLCVMLFLGLVASHSASALTAADIPPLKITPINQHVYLIQSYVLIKPWGIVGSNSLVMFKGDEAFLIDTPWTNQDTQKLSEWINSKGKRLTLSISTHSHADRAGGIGWLNKQGIATYTSALTDQFLEKAHKPRAKYTFTDTVFTLADGDIEIFYPGSGHTKDNLVVWLPQHDVLFGGCLIRSRVSRSLGSIADAVLRTWPKTTQNVQQRYPNPAIVIPGHGRYGSKALLSHTFKLATKNAK